MIYLIIYKYIHTQKDNIAKLESKSHGAINKTIGVFCFTGQKLFAYLFAKIYKLTLAPWRYKVTS